MSASDGTTATGGGAAARPAPRMPGLARLLVALGVVLLVQGLFVVSYVGALHKPQPHDLPFGVVGTPAAGLAAAVDKQLSLRTTTYTDASAAARAIDRRSIYGALITDPSGTSLCRRPCCVERCSNSPHDCLYEGCGRRRSEADGRPGAPACGRRQRRHCPVPRRHGIGRRRLSLRNDGHFPGRRHRDSSTCTDPRGRCGHRRARDLFARRSAHWRHTFRPLPGALGHLHAPDACGRLRGGRAANPVRDDRDPDRDRRLRCLRRSGRRWLRCEAFPPELLGHDRPVSPPGGGNDSRSKHDLLRRQRDREVAHRSGGLSRCGCSRRLRNPLRTPQASDADTDIETAAGAAAVVV